MNSIKSFQTLNQELKLSRFLGSEFGTMYFDPNASRENENIIRHLDGELSAELLPVYIKLYEEIRLWIESNISDCVFMPKLIEIGEDYIVRPFYVYHISNKDYFDPDEPVQPPVEFYQMIIIVSNNLKINAENESIVERIVRKSLLGSNGKIFYTTSINQFILVEPKISLADLIEYSEG